MAMIMVTPTGESVSAVEEAPVDGKLYGRKNEAWKEVPENMPDAPIDGEYYARKNAAWAALEGISEALEKAEQVTQNHIDAAKYAANPSKDNPFLTQSEMPYLEKRVADFERMEWPDGLSTLYSVCFGEDIFAAVGDNCAAVSSDGRNWEIKETPSGFWRSVAYGGGVFSAVGLDRHAMYSEDNGQTWLSSTAPTGDWNAVAFGNGFFIAVSEGKIMKSTDGKTGWSSKKINSGYGEAVCFGNGTFTAIGSAGAMTSTDGENWSLREVPKATWRCGDFGDGRFVMLAGKCAYSDDGGVTWEASSLPSGGWDAVQYGGGFFAAVGNSAQCIIANSQTLDWEQKSVPNFIWRDLAFGFDTFVAVGSGIMAAKLVDTAAALNNSNAPNGTNTFATMLDLALIQDVVTTQATVINTLQTEIQTLKNSLIITGGN